MALSKAIGKPRAQIRIAITTIDVIALISDTTLKIHEIIGDSVNCNRMMIDLHRPIIRSFMVCLLDEIIDFEFLIRYILAIVVQRCICGF